MLIKRENHIKYKYGGVLKVNKRQEKIVLLLNDIMNSQLLNPTYEVDIIFEMKLMLHCLQHKNL